MTAERQPDRLDAFWAKHHPPPPEPKPLAGPVAAPGAADAYARAAFDNELAILAAATPGSRNHTLNKCAYNLGQLVASGHLDQRVTWDALYATALSTGLGAAETRNTIDSAFRAANEVPRDVPELDTAVPEATVIEDPAEEPTSGVEDMFPLVPWADWWDQEPDDDWIIYPLLPARRLVALFSPPKIGKSLLMLELAVAISRGEPVFGTTPDAAHRVLYVDLENDPRGDVIARLKDMGRKPAELDQLCYLSFPRLPMLDTAMGGLQLLAVVEHYGCDVVVIDTISRIVAGEENDNDTWLAFYRHTGLALKAAGVSTIRLDHSGKDAAKGMRGASAKYGDVDLVWSLTLIEDDELHLECSANRLPVNDKNLVLHRKLDPLRHDVDRGHGAVRTAEDQACIDAMLRAGVVPGDSQRSALAKMQAAGSARKGHRVAGDGKFSKHHIEDCLPKLAVHQAPTELDWQQRQLKDP